MIFTVQEGRQNGRKSTFFVYLLGKSGHFGPPRAGGVILGDFHRPGAPLDAPRDSRRLPEAPGGSQRVPEALRGSQRRRRPSWAVQHIKISLVSKSKMLIFNRSSAHHTRLCCGSICRRSHLRLRCGSSHGQRSIEYSAVQFSPSQFITAPLVTVQLFSHSSVQLIIVQSMSTRHSRCQLFTVDVVVHLMCVCGKC